MTPAMSYFVDTGVGNQFVSPIYPRAISEASRAGENDLISESPHSCVLRREATFDRRFILRSDMDKQVSVRSVIPDPAEPPTPRTAECAHDSTQQAHDRPHRPPTTPLDLPCCDDVRASKNRQIDIRSGPARALRLRPRPTAGEPLADGCFVSLRLIIMPSNGGTAHRQAEREISHPCLRPLHRRLTLPRSIRRASRSGHHRRCGRPLYSVRSETG